ncbi:hypothetical protein [Methylobacterium sp. J-067]|uniref:hypothetical protein n=1 Tax=Methylobacterium sp. J-067 TaxID=2836648 RepID=UPI001FB9ABA1|nr:hypothetical protein [Methylobacterium sp. J-067]MCJ2022698.1 hypothetical protein [Methylobacterium sp. J-067]
MTQQRRFYIVKGKASHGSVTHLCPTVSIAIDTLKRFRQGAVQDIQIFDPNGDAMSPNDLEASGTGAEKPEPAAFADHI